MRGVVLNWNVSEALRGSYEGYACRMAHHLGMFNGRLACERPEQITHAQTRGSLMLKRERSGTMTLGIAANAPI